MGTAAALGSSRPPPHRARTVLRCATARILQGWASQELVWRPRCVLVLMWPRPNGTLPYAPRENAGGTKDDTGGTKDDTGSAALVPERHGETPDPLAAQGGNDRLTYQKTLDNQDSCPAILSRHISVDKSSGCVFATDPC
jgi:hypothetical protein